MGKFAKIVLASTVAAVVNLQGVQAWDVEDETQDQTRELRASAWKVPKKYRAKKAGGRSHNKKAQGKQSVEVKRELDEQLDEEVPDRDLRAWDLSTLRASRSGRGPGRGPSGNTKGGGKGTGRSYW